jgi:hypothetical protein
VCCSGSQPPVAHALASASPELSSQICAAHQVRIPVWARAGAAEVALNGAVVEGCAGIVGGGYCTIAADFRAGEDPRTELRGRFTFYVFVDLPFTFFT